MRVAWQCVGKRAEREGVDGTLNGILAAADVAYAAVSAEIARASRRERASISELAVPLKNKKHQPPQQNN